MNWCQELTFSSDYGHDKVRIAVPSPIGLPVNRCVSGTGRQQDLTRPQVVI